LFVVVGVAEVGLPGVGANTYIYLVTGTVASERLTRLKADVKAERLT
jgi:hypothetical protein